MATPLCQGIGLNLQQFDAELTKPFVGAQGRDIDYFQRLTAQQRELGWRYSLDTSAMIAQGNVTTDQALPGKFFSVLENSGTATLGSSQAGYEGNILSTTGSAGIDTNVWVGYDTFLPALAVSTGGNITTGPRTAWISQNVYHPLESAATLYDYWLGFFPKTTTPGDTAPTDGVWIAAKNNSAGGLIPVGNVVSNSGTALTVTTFPTLTAAQSMRWGIVWQPGWAVDFYYKQPSTAPTFSVADTLAPWTLAGSISLTTASGNANPRATISHRPHMAHIQQASATHAMNFESMQYGIQQQFVR